MVIDKITNAIIAVALISVLSAVFYVYFGHNALEMEANKTFYTNVKSISYELNLAIDEYKHYEKKSPIRNTFEETLKTLFKDRHLKTNSLSKILDNNIFDFEIKKIHNQNFIVSNFKESAADTNKIECKLINQFSESINKKHFISELENNSIPLLAHVDNIEKLDGLCFYDQTTNMYSFYHKLAI